MSIRAILTEAFVDSDSKYNKVKEICSNFGDGEWKITDPEERGVFWILHVWYPRPEIPYEEICN